MLFKKSKLTYSKLYNYALAGAQYQEKNEPSCLSWVATKAMDPMKLLQGASEEDALEGELIINQELVPYMFF